MINAIIQSRNNTLITELPVGIYTLYERLTSVGINVSPKRINISDNDEDEICVKLYSESDFGNHLIRVLNEENTLADANLLAMIVQDAREEMVMYTIRENGTSLRSGSTNSGIWVFRAG